MDAEINGRRVIVEAPPGNAPGESRERDLTRCLPERGNLPHVWEIEKDGFGEPTGRMFCLWCKKKAPMKRSLGVWAPQPVCSRTGY